MSTTLPSGTLVLRSSGPRSRWVIFRTRHARDLAAAMYRRQGMNYTLYWNDKAGFGLHATVSTFRYHSA